MVLVKGSEALLNEHRGCGCSVPYTYTISTTMITAPTTRGNLDQDSIGSTTGDWLTSTDFISAKASSSVGRRRLISTFFTPEVN